MNYIFLNLKRFDIPAARNGVNRLVSPDIWGTNIVSMTKDGMKPYPDAAFVAFMPEAHILPAVAAKEANGVANLAIGCQGVFRFDTAEGGNFGAFTTNLTANAAAALGCEWALIGHCEERKDKAEIIQAGGGNDLDAVNEILNQEVHCAVSAGLKVLYCVGEKADELEISGEVLNKQIMNGLSGIINGKDKDKIVIAYEPVWAIGPGKTPPDREYIEKTVDLIKELTGGLPVVYGGGLKAENAGMLASIKQLDGGLIALTRFTPGDFGFYPNEYNEIVAKYMEVRL